MRNLYEILGVLKTATAEEIKKAYRDQAKILHPDIGDSSEVFRKTAEAYAVLKDKEKRRIYDMTGETILNLDKKKEQYATEVIREMFKSLLKHHQGDLLEVDVINKMKTRLKENIERFAKEMKGCKEQIKLMERLCKRAGCKAPMNIIGGVLEHESRQACVAKLNLDTKIQGSKLALKLLKAHHFRFDKVKEPERATLSTTYTVGGLTGSF